jgi:hypothetical protein
MDVDALEKSLAFGGAILVGATAAYQLRNEWPVRGMDAQVTKLLLALMILGCVLALLAALDVIGVHKSA